MAKPGRILIVGGGTAGWMTACYLVKHWGAECQISLIESQVIGTVGVGEGSTPYLKDFFAQLGISETQWMAACDATYKAGIRFSRWSTRAGFESYFHPFFCSFDQQPAQWFFHNCGLRRRGKEASAHPDDYFVAAETVRRGQTPVLKQPLDVVSDYAYHFDASKLGLFLRDWAVARGVTHYQGQIQQVIANDVGIQQVISDTQGPLSADFFIDCSGFRSLLLQQSLQQPFHSYSATLFNDAAVAIPTLHRQPDFAYQTESNALSSGWAWRIPLRSRWGNGYVYSSAHISAAQAETELRAQLGLNDSEEVAARHLRMPVGRLQQHWYKNCLAIGLSQGFIEPLEATALMLTQFAIQGFVELVTEGLGQAQQQRYNQRMNTSFDGVRDYIAAHYWLNSRNDSAYWRDCREEIQVPPLLAELYEVWRGGGDFEAALNLRQSALAYLRPSWYCIFAGMGCFPNNLQATQEAVKRQKGRDYCRQVVTQYFC